MALKGTNGDDEFDGTIFDDEIFGLDGDDSIGSSPGADTIDGGDDEDTVDYQGFRSALVQWTIFGEQVNVDLQRSVQFGGYAEGDVLIDIENIAGSPEDDIIRGDSGANRLDGNSGDDTLEGRGGDDILAGDFNGLAQVHFQFLPDGNDDLDGGAGDDTLLGQGGADTLLGGIDNDQLLGGDGNDTLFGDQGFDRLDGGAGIDTANYLGSASAVTVFLNAGIGAGGDAGGDVLVSVENVTGSTFGDSLIGSSAANVLSGSTGNDALAGLAGADTLNGGIGFDTASYVASASGVTVDLTLGTATGGDADGDTLIAIENLTGSNFVDSLVGNAFTNILNGGGGADQLAGRGGNDIYIVDNAGDTITEAGGQGSDEVRTSANFTLTAGADVETLRTADDNGVTALSLAGNAAGNTVRGNNGANLINGADGNDTLTGLGGADSFVFNNLLNATTNVDVITDFNAADDTIQVDNGIFTGLTAGTLGANQFVIAATAQDADDRIVYDVTNGALFFDIDGVGGATAVRFATVSAGLALTNLDFLVF